MTKENDAIVSTANGDEDIQRRLTSRVQQLKNSEAINEIGPKTAAKALSLKTDPRRLRILQDAANSLFGQYLNKDLNILFQGNKSGKPAKYVLVEVKINHKYAYSTIDFYFHNENGVDTNAPYANNRKDLAFTYSIKNDTFTNKGNDETKFTNIRELMNAAAVNFFVKAAKWIRSIYYKHNPPMIDVNGEMVQDPKFKIESSVNKDDFSMF